MEKKKIVKTPADLSKAKALDKIRAFISPGSAAGKVDADRRKRKMDEAISKAGG